MARICIVRQFHLQDDPRVKRELRALLDAGHAVDVVCMRRSGESVHERTGNLRVHRLPIAHKRGGLARYLVEYVGFFVLATLYVGLLDMRRRFELVQVNTVPDWIVFAALGPRLRGVPVLLDLHECMPEFFASKFGTDLRHPGVRLLARLEQASIRFASFAITCTAQMKDAFVARGADPDRISVVMNSADEATFDPRRYPSRPRTQGRFTLVSHGTLEERYGVDTIIRAVGRLRSRVPGLTLEVYGHGPYEEDLRALTAELELTDRVHFRGFVPMDELLEGIADADAGVVAMKRDAFRDLTHCNKMFDLITMRRPVICSRTASVMAYFPNGALKYFESDDDVDLARAIGELHGSESLAPSLVEHATAQNEAYRWPHQREIYLQTVETVTSLTSSRRVASRTSPSDS